MPHLQIDYSPGVPQQIDLQAFLKELCEEFSSYESVEPKALKCYARPASHYQPGLGAPEDFIHLTVCLLEGRSASLLGQMSQGLYSVGQNHLKTSSLRCSWTLEIRQMSLPTYQKGTIG
ncbi:MAG: hypothetical protein KF824_06995 [Fimbriimonadaceae bacterium]|nr:MAG: hypothetical protein KF824_06995 [Fimbriimonadaceae bacterium]